MSRPPIAYPLKVLPEHGQMQVADAAWYEVVGRELAGTTKISIVK
jgi:hypothetical protein